MGIAASALHSFQRFWLLPEHETIRQSCVMSILLYGSELWTLLQPDTRKLKARHLRCQRQILWCPTRSFAPYKFVTYLAYLLICRLEWLCS